MNISTFRGRNHVYYDPYRFQFVEPFHDSVHFPGIIVPPPPPPPPAVFTNVVSPFVNARIHWTETPEAHVLRAELPGLRKEEVKVEVDDNRLLRISGEWKVEKEEKSDKWHRVERSGARFLQSYGLPESAKPEKMKASMENGVLTVTIPKEDFKFNRQTRTIPLS